MYQNKNPLIASLKNFIDKSVNKTGVFVRLKNKINKIREPIEPIQIPYRNHIQLHV